MGNKKYQIIYPKSERIDVMKCQICGKDCDGVAAFTHRRCTGHNLWIMILPKPDEKGRINGVQGLK